MVSNGKAMIQDDQLAWLKEHLLFLAVSDADRQSALEIVETVKKLWHVVKACEKNPYPRSPRLTEALEATKIPTSPFKR